MTIASAISPPVSALTSAELVNPRGFQYDEVQTAVEEIYELRAKVIRIGLMGTLLYRPDPIHETSAAEQAEIKEVLNSEADTFASVVEMIKNCKPHAHVKGDMCKWIHNCCKAQPEALDKVVQINLLCQHLRAASNRADPDQTQILRQHMYETRDGFHTAIVTLCEQMWEKYDASRVDELDTSRKAADALSDRLARLERIGTHVRLVSLNASVEAARVGDAGRGLAVIAQEFKVLAEEVQQIAKLAKGDVTLMATPQ